VCAYQRINNSYACHNSKTQNGILKGDVGFEGFIVADWRALRKGYQVSIHGIPANEILDTGVAAVEGGLDMAMPNGSIF
jgi:beta-glucosidase